MPLYYLVGNSIKCLRELTGSRDQMLRTSYMALSRTITFREKPELDRSPIKVRAFSVMNVKTLSILEHNVLHISRDNTKGCLFLGQMMIPLKVQLRMNLLKL